MKEYITSTDVELSPIERGEIHEFVASSIIFEKKYATFKITHDENCDITYDDTVDYEVGDTVVLQITTTPPNNIVSLLVNDVEMVELIDTDDMTLTLTVAQLSNVINITSGVTVATFDITHDENCDITYDDTVDYEIGDTVVLQITRTDLYEIRSLLVNDVEMVELIDDNAGILTLTLTVAQLSNVINVTSGVHAGITVNDSVNSHTTYEQKTYYIGDTIIFNLSFDEGNELDTVVFNDTDVTADVVDNTLTKVLTQAANTLVVSSVSTATVTVTDDASSHTTYEQKTYYIGDTVIFNLSFDEGNELDTVTFNGVDVTADVVDNTLTKELTAPANTLNVTSKTTGQ